MNTKNINSDDFLKKSIQSDAPSITCDAAIEHRINYYYHLQHSKQKMHANSFGGIFVWIFSTQTFALKSGFIVLASVFLLAKSPVIQNSSNLSVDTCENRTMIGDTNAIVKDTCFN